MRDVRGTPDQRILMEDFQVKSVGPPILVGFWFGWGLIGVTEGTLGRVGLGWGAVLEGALGTHDVLS
jgi:hypothetical protein